VKNQKVKVTEYWDDEEQRVNPWYSVVPEFSSLSVWELPPGIEGGNRFTSTAINPDLLLPWLQSVLEKRYGVVFIKDTVSSLESAAQRLGCKALVNATGLGAGQLAGDNKVLGIRGQTLLIKSSALAPSLEHQLVIRRGREYTYLIPRMDGGVVLGGIEDPGNTSINVDVALRPDIIRRVNVMTRGRFRGFDLERDVIRDIVGFRPGREGGFRVERESNVIHAYGFAGAGYRYSWGVSSKVVDLVDELGFRKQQSKL
jgi:glycine/D-amino acid oxidase-like deaminating enzyme